MRGFVRWLAGGVVLVWDGWVKPQRRLPRSHARGSGLLIDTALSTSEGLTVFESGSVGLKPIGKVPGLPAKIFA